jgi:hypothetical protein
MALPILSPEGVGFGFFVYFAHKRLIECDYWEQFESTVRLPTAYFSQNKSAAGAASGTI